MLRSSSIWFPSQALETEKKEKTKKKKQKKKTKIQCATMEISTRSLFK